MWKYGFHASRLLTVALLFVIAGQPCQAAAPRQIAWRTDLKKAAQESERTQKPMLLEFTASWCHYCKKKFRTTFQDPRVVRSVNECFVPVTVDFDRNRELAKAVGVDSIPTTVIISPELKVVQKITGYHPAAQYSQHIGSVRQAYKKQIARRAALANLTRTAAETQEPLAFGGHCLVSMLTTQKLTKGRPEFTSNYRGKRVAFASAELQRQFEAEPEQFWPANSGICPVSVKDDRSATAGKPQIAVIYQKRLWFFASREHRLRFARSPKQYTRATQSALTN